VITLDPITRRRLARFRSMRRGWWSLQILLVLLALALLGPALVGNRPLVLAHGGELRFPFLADPIPAAAVGLEGEGEPNWRLVQARWKEEGAASWLVMPPIPFSATEVCEVNLPAERGADGLWRANGAVLAEGRLFNLRPDGSRARSWTVVNGRLHGDARQTVAGQPVRAKFDDGRLAGQFPPEPAAPAGAWEPSGTLFTYVPAPAPPGLDGHWLGTDESGHDILARLFGGFRTFLAAACVFIPAMYLIGLLLGAAMGYFGGWFDLLGQRLIEIWSNIPFLYAVILLSTLLEPSLTALMIILVAFSWIGLAHQMRAAAFSAASKDYVAASRTLGAGHLRIIVRHILPNTVTVAVTLLPFSFAALIASLSALDYLGFGLPPTEPSWGDLLRQGRENWTAWWIGMPTVACMVGLLVLVNFVGEAVREAFDARKTDA
jgi:microcin C transport system permease protein